MSTIYGWGGERELFTYSNSTLPTSKGLGVLGHHRYLPEWENGNGKLKTFVPRETQNLKWSMESTHWPKDAGPLQVRSLLDDPGQVPSVSLIKRLILTGFSTFRTFPWFKTPIPEPLLSWSLSFIHSVLLGLVTTQELCSCTRHSLEQICVDCSSLVTENSSLFLPSLQDTTLLKTQEM